jgi:hypothetical protein
MRQLEARARSVDELERQLAARERAALVAEERATAVDDEQLEVLRSELNAREAELMAREAELVKLQAGLAAQGESIRRRERALEDAEVRRDREAALPATPYVSFNEGLDAFAGSRTR